jgi:BirA family transcriptional regulator, biotin operon repressor / biotin---[acetyl-CoA-carboxylase] ligase
MFLLPSTLATMSTEHLDLSALNNLLRTQQLGKAAGWANEVWDSTESTNTRALELARQGAPAGVIVAARQQTAGKGRLGRRWVSPTDAGLYISFLLRPQLDPSACRLLSFAAGVAAVEAIETICGFAVGLKWVNDIVYGGKKLGGILSEMSQNQVDDKASTAIVVGIGLNLRAPAEGVPEEIAALAIYLESLTESPVDANQLAAAIAARLEAAYMHLHAGNSAEVLKLWRKHSVTLGRNVKASAGQTEHEGLAVDIADDGALIMQLESGERIRLHTGDVSVRNSDGSYC